MRRDVQGFSFRLLLLSALLIVPFFRMLLRDAYGVFYPEVMAALLLLLAAAACLAAVSRNRVVFCCAVVAVITIHSVNAVQLDFFHSAQVRWLLLGISLSCFVGWYLLKEHFYHIVLVFVVGGLIVDIGQALSAGSTRTDSARPGEQRNLKPVVHVILDEMIGLAGMPPQYGACIAARNHVQKVLEEHAFQIYPYAFSNYRSTRDSIPSILNGRLLKRTEEFLTDEDQRPVLSQNLYFDAYRRKGYVIRAYQSDYVTFATGNSEAVRVREYRSNNLRAMHAIPLPWTARLRQIAVIYLQSDQFWWGTWQRVLPPYLHPKRLGVGPLAFQGLWPDQVLHDFRSATQNSLFFIHVLTPHYPYVYAANGALTDFREWNSDSILTFPENEPGEYVSHYRRYCEQVQFVATQLEKFLDGLKDSGLYDSTTVIIHGDHGSRLRLLRAEDEALRLKLERTPGACPIVSRYDYNTEPDARDLLNRFSTLLGIKPAGATTPEIVNERGSVLFFLLRAFHYAPQSNRVDDMNSAYLFDPGGSPRAIRTIVQAFDTAL
jgi:hypothetical protein